MAFKKKLLLLKSSHDLEKLKLIMGKIWDNEGSGFGSCVWYEKDVLVGNCSQHSRVIWAPVLMLKS